jgi:3-hydroxybutyryl-CoA dehydratase
MTGTANPAGRRLAKIGLLYGEVEPGDWYETGGRTVTAATIDAFAELTGDRFEIHMSDEAAQRHGFRARVAHGLLVLSLVDGLKNQAEAQFRAIASLGWTWTFAAPVEAGDTIRAVVEVLSKRTTRNPERGILSLGFTVTNQRGETVQYGENKLMVYR